MEKAWRDGYHRLRSNCNGYFVTRWAESHKTRRRGVVGVRRFPRGRRRGGSPPAPQVYVPLNEGRSVLPLLSIRQGLGAVHPRVGELQPRGRNVLADDEVFESQGGLTLVAAVGLGRKLGSAKGRWPPEHPPANFSAGVSGPLGLPLRSAEEVTFGGRSHTQRIRRMFGWCGVEVARKTQQRDRVQSSLRREAQGIQKSSAASPVRASSECLPRAERRLALQDA